MDFHLYTPRIDKGVPNVFTKSPVKLKAENNNKKKEVKSVGMQTAEQVSNGAERGSLLWQQQH